MNPPARRADTSGMEKVRELAADIEVAMLTTVGVNGLVRSRPMGTVFDPDTPAVWLLLPIDSKAAEEVRQHPQVGLAYADPERDRYVSLSGDATFLQGRDEIRHVWRDAFAKWFPGGPDDPNLALLRVDLRQAEYWDDSAKYMRDFFETIGAPYSGVPPEAVGEHGRVRPR